MDDKEVNALVAKAIKGNEDSLKSLMLPRFPMCHVACENEFRKIRDKMFPEAKEKEQEEAYQKLRFEAIRKAEAEYIREKTSGLHGDVSQEILHGIDVMKLCEGFVPRRKKDDSDEGYFIPIGYYKDEAELLRILCYSGDRQGVCPFGISTCAKQLQQAFQNPPQFIDESYENIVRLLQKHSLDCSSFICRNLIFAVLPEERKWRRIPCWEIPLKNKHNFDLHHKKLSEKAKNFWEAIAKANYAARTKKVKGSKTKRREAEEQLAEALSQLQGCLYETACSLAANPLAYDKMTGCFTVDWLFFYDGKPCYPCAALSPATRSISFEFIKEMTVCLANYLKTVTFDPKTAWDTVWHADCKCDVSPSKDKDNNICSMAELPDMNLPKKLLDNCIDFIDVSIVLSQTNDPKTVFPQFLASLDIQQNEKDNWPILLVPIGELDSPAQSGKAKKTREGDDKPFLEAIDGKPGHYKVNLPVGKPYPKNHHAILRVSFNVFESCISSLFDWNLVFIPKKVWSSNQTKKELDTIEDSITGNTLLVPFCESKSDYMEFKKLKHRAAPLFRRFTSPVLLIKQPHESKTSFREVLKDNLKKITTKQTIVEQMFNDSQIPKTNNPYVDLITQEVVEFYREYPQKLDEEGTFDPNKMFSKYRYDIDFYKKSNPESIYPVLPDKFSEEFMGTISQVIDNHRQSLSNANSKARPFNTAVLMAILLATFDYVLKHESNKEYAGWESNTIEKKIQTIDEHIKSLEKKKEDGNYADSWLGNRLHERIIKDMKEILATDFHRLSMPATPESPSNE